jgi:methionyl aminopeptidase
MNRPLGSNDACWCGSGRKYKRCHKGSPGTVRAGVQSPRRSVPESIERPEYALTGQVTPTGESMVKPPEVIERMRHAGRIAAEVLALTGAAVAPGVTTDELDALAHQACIERGAYPSPLNYRGYPKSICTSVNEVICHGIPDDRPLGNGEIVNLDVTAYVGGVHGDTNATFLVGDVDPATRTLVRVTRQCLELGIAAVKPGRPISDIGRAIQSHAEAHGFGVVRTFVGHGIGRQFHMAPTIYHYYAPQASTIMEPGMTFTIEPMITLGAWQARMWADGWTAVTVDGRPSAQFEQTLVVTEAGADILTPFLVPSLG